MDTHPGRRRAFACECSNMTLASFENAWRLASNMAEGKRKLMPRTEPKSEIDDKCECDANG